MEKNLLSTLKSNEINLSKSQRQVADYIIKYPVESSFVTLETLAKRLQISTTTIIRFCGKLGYSGYSSLQKDLQKLVKERIAPQGRLEANLPHINKDTLLAQCAQKSIENITLSQSLITNEICEATLKMILTARRIYLFGARTSHTASYFMFHALNQILGNCILVDPISQIDQLSTATDQDVVVVVSLPRYSKNTIQIIATVKKQCHSKVIAITDSYTAPIAKYSDIVIPCHYGSLSFHNSMSSALFIAEYIVTAVAVSQKKQTKESLGKLENFLEDLDFHID